jgi:peptidoglycan hydrolase-like protein with peptidoglycan-binding domain
MSAPTSSSGNRTADGRASPPGRFSRRRVALAAALIVVVAVVVLVVSNPFAGSGASERVLNDGETALATIARQPLAAQTTSSGTLGFAGSYTVVNAASGTLTGLPVVGKIVSQGAVLYRVSGAPVILLAGSVPSYRLLSRGSAGPDVEQLNRDLVALRYASGVELSPSSADFGAATTRALEALQGHVGLKATGTLALGQAVFLPVGRLRVTAVNGTLGGRAVPASALLTGSSAERVVSVNLDAAEQVDIAVGDRVTITLPEGSKTAGVVSSVGTVAVAGSNGGSATVPVTIRPIDPAATGSIDQAPVDVAVTTASVRSALVVPIDALLALSGGGYAVEEVSPQGRHHLVAVSLGLFDDASGLVGVSGSGVAAGQRVVVPSL